MALCGNIINLVEIGVLLVACGCSIAAAIMIGLTTNQFGNQCVLKASVENRGGNNILIYFSGLSRCNFCLLVHVAALLLAFAFCGYRILVLCKGKYDIRVLGRFVTSILFGIMAFFMLIVACLVTVGLQTFCSNLYNGFSTLKPATCTGFQDTIIWDEDRNGAHFHDNLTTAGATSWISLLLWLTMMALSLASHCIFKRTKPDKKSSTQQAKTQGPV